MTSKVKGEKRRKFSEVIHQIRQRVNSGQTTKLPYVNNYKQRICYEEKSKQQNRKKNVD